MATLASIAVIMTITMFTPNGKTLKEEWQIVESTNMEHCIYMNEIFAQGGSRGASIVSCKVIK